MAYHFIQWLPCSSHKRRIPTSSKTWRLQSPAFASRTRREQESLEPSPVTYSEGRNRSQLTPTEPYWPPYVAARFNAPGHVSIASGAPSLVRGGRSYIETVWGGYQLASVIFRHGRHLSPYLTEPGTNDSEGATSVPSSSLAFFMSNAAMTFAIASQMLTSAKRRPGHMLAEIRNGQAISVRHHTQCIELFGSPPPVAEHNVPGIQLLCSLGACS